MRISTVIPSYNRRDTLPRALQSVFAQSRQVDEVILVDDGSSDGSADMVEDRFAEVRVIRQPNLGARAGSDSACCEGSDARLSRQ